jgi:hypothetical protein
VSGNEPPKSAVELAMERLRKKDADMGIEQLTLTDEQKAAIAEIRNFYEARLAEQKILHEAALRKAFDPAEREALEAGSRHDRERLIAERDAKIEKVRKTS